MATLTEVSQEDKRIGGGYFRPQLQRNAIIRVTGSLTQEQIETLRADNRNVRLLFDNTTNITAEQVRALDQPNITFQVLSGYKGDKVGRQERTIMTPKALGAALEYLEEVEKYIDPNWTNEQKAMYFHASTYRDITIDENVAKEIRGEDTNQSLNGVAFRRMACAGMSNLNYEFCMRQGIECVYQATSGVHAWNIMKLGGAWRGVESTWENSKGKKEGATKCPMEYFGREDTRSFYDNPKRHKEEGHDLLPHGVREYDLVAYTQEEIDANYAAIQETFESIPRIEGPEMTPERAREYLVYEQSFVLSNNDRDALENSDNQREGMMYDLVTFLKNNGACDAKTAEMCEAFTARRGLLMDVKLSGVKGAKIVSGDETGIEEFAGKGYEFPRDPGDKSSGNITKDSEGVFETLNGAIQAYFVDYAIYAAKNADRLMDEREEYESLGEDISDVDFAKKVDLETKFMALEKIAPLLVGSATFDRELETYGMSRDEVMAKLAEMASWDQDKAKDKGAEGLEK